MTPTEKLIDERRQAEAINGLFVTPYRMARLMAAASKIMDIMVRADTNISYDECKIILRLVQDGIGAVQVGGNEA